MDVPKYTTILHEVRTKLGLTMNEYAVADLVHKLSTNPKGSIQGWCYASKPYIGKVLGLSEQSIHSILRSLLGAGLIEKHPETKHLRATEKWFNAAVVSEFSQTEETLASADATTTKDSLATLNQQDLGTLKNLEPIPKETLARSTQESLANNNSLDNNTDKEVNTSSYEEVQQAAVTDDVKSKREPLEGEVATLPTSKPKKARREPNPDGSYGKPQVNEVRSYFLEKQNISGEDCTQRESGWYWDLLLKYVEAEAPGVDPVVALKKFIDCLVSGQYIEPSRITSSKRLYYNRHELMKKIRENKTRYSKLTKQVPIDYDNVAGGVAW
jgi:hypothetical protein